VIDVVWREMERLRDGKVERVRWRKAGLQVRESERWKGGDRQCMMERVRDGKREMKRVTTTIMHCCYF